MLPFRCCCVGEWFDFYDQPDDNLGADSGVVRTGACTPPNTDPDAYDSGDYSEPYETTNSEGNYSVATGFTASSFSDDDLGDYVWYHFNKSGTYYLQLYKCEAGEAGPQEEYSISGYQISAAQWQYPWHVPENLNYTGNPDIFRRDGIGSILSPYGQYQQIQNRRNGKFRCNSAGECQFCDTSGDVIDVDETGSDSTTTLTAESISSRATDDARVMIHAFRALPWAAGQSIELSSPSSGVVRHTLKFYTGELASAENVTKTNLIATKTLDASVTVGQEAAAIAAMYNAFGPGAGGTPDYWWTIGHYDRNENGDEILQLIKHEFRTNSGTPFQEEEWYANGTLFYSNSTFTTSGSDNFCGITAAIAVDPDPALSTDTKFVILRKISAGSTTYDIVGIDADGDDVWDKQNAADLGTFILDASDRYVYVSGTGLGASTETGGVVTTAEERFLVRLDGGVAWPFVGHSTTTQILRTGILNGGQRDSSYKSSLVPHTAEIDIAAQFTGNYT